MSENQDRPITNHTDHQITQTTLNKVKRRLFSRDEVPLQSTADRDNAEHLREMTAKYNFDFANGVPSKGPYAWQAVASDIVGLESAEDEPEVVEDVSGSGENV